MGETNDINKKTSGEVVKPSTSTPARTTGQKLTAAALVLFILAAALLAAHKIINSQPTPQRKPPQKIRTMTQVQPVKKQNKTVILETMGTVLSSRRLSLKPSVSGTVETISKQLVPGGMVHKGDILLTLDPRDYQLTFEQTQNDHESALMDLRLEQGNQAVAKREYELIKEYAGDSLLDAPMDLALREPQLAKAKTRAAVAMTAMKMAALNLGRTKITAPFNGIILEKNVETGAQVNNQTTVATLAGTDRYWVRVALPQKDLGFLKLPENEKEGSPAVITNIGQKVGAEMWEGKIIRILGDVDPQGLMARILIAVDNPTRPASGKMPLLLGSIVRVKITGLPLNNCYPIPRAALRPDNRVLLASPENTLIIRPVTIAWQSESEVYVLEGLSDNEQLIISNVAAPIAGMPITIQQ